MSPRHLHPGSLLPLALATCLATCLPAPSARAATCPPIATPVYVGNTATDNQCDYDSIQDAIDASTCPRNIVVSGASYASQHLTITDQSLVLIGQPGGCGPMVGQTLATGAATRVALNGDGANPVVSITGSGNVTLSSLEITGGQGAANSLAGGGGIVVNGSGANVTLNNLDVHDNNGGDGAGIAIYGDGKLSLHGVSIHGNHASGGGGGLAAQSSYIGSIEVEFVGDPDMVNLVSANDAQHDGGGIMVSGNVHLRMAMPATARTYILSNRSEGGGGGLAILGKAVADIALPAGGINGNTAGFGGGIKVGTTSGGGALLRLFNTDPSQPIALFGNQADYSGGAMYLGSGNATAHATACLHGVGMVANSAEQHGTAIVVDRFAHLVVNPVDDPECDPEAVAVQGAVACSMDTPGCNELRANNATFTGSGYANVSIIDVAGENAELRVRRLRVSDNGGGNVIRASDAGNSTIDFNQCLIVHNTLSHELVSLSGTAASFDGCTFAANTIGGATAFVQDSGLHLTRSIVQETVQVFDPDAAGLDARYLILSEPKLPADPSVFFLDARFVNPGAGNFRLAETSPAIDFAPAGGDMHDLDNLPRDIDSGAVSNLYGPRDLGAHERAPACYRGDTVYCDGFES